LQKCPEKPAEPICCPFLRDFLKFYFILLIEYASGLSDSRDQWILLKMRTGTPDK
jgi:hypothetical protein